MSFKRKTKPRLNKSNLKAALALICLSFLILPNLNQAKSEPKVHTENTIEAIVTPEAPSLGDTITVKVKKTPGETKPPKIFFNTNKMPTFVLSDTYYRTLIPLSANFKPGKYPIEIYYKGKGKKIDLTVKDTKYLVENLTLTKEVASLKASRIEKKLVGHALNTLSPEKYWKGKFIFPSTAKRSTAYGVKRKINGVLDPDYFHKGLDFAAQEGSNIISPENGKVVLAGHNSNGFVANGNCVFIDHGHGVVSGYLHLSKTLVKEGEFINKGQIIGKVGSTGIASGPHLHWGLYVLGMTVDPIVWTNMVIE